MKTVYSQEYALVLKALLLARKAAGLTQLQLAELLGKQQTFVSKYERGERRLDVVEFVTIARCLGVDPHAVIADFEAIAPQDGGDK
ncbi:MAG: helix-turn-helix transcriptional regulator [Halothiobacillus sp.]|nr:helix-turn-helix transcriptional regulator [Halothiobacillus sp.]